MEALLVLVVAAFALAVPLVGPLLALVAWSRTRQLEQRVRSLEQQLEAGRARDAAPPVPRSVAPPAADPVAPPAAEPVAPKLATVEPTDEATPAPPAAAPTPATLAPPSAPSPVPRPTRAPLALPSPERIATWVAASLGGFAVLLGGMLGLAVAVEAGWLGPAARVGGAMVLGAIAWSVAPGLRARGFHWVGSALAGVGVGVGYAALFAGTSLYRLLPSWVGFVGMTAISAVALLHAVRSGARALGWLGLIGGAMVPFLLSSGRNDPLGLFSYLVLLLAAALGAAHRRGWPDLVLGGALAASALHLGWTIHAYRPDQVLAGVLGALAIVAPFWLLALLRPPAGGAVAKRLVGGVAVAAVLVLPWLALPWLVPVDPVFYDPVGNVTVARADAAGAWRAALGATALLVPGLVLARLSERLEVALPSLVSGSALLVAVQVWAGVDPVPVLPLVVGLLGPGALAGVALPRSGVAGVGLGLVPAGLGILSLGVVASGSGPAFAAVVAGVLAVGVVPVWLGASRALFVSTLIGLTAVTWAGSASEVGPRWLAGGTLVAYAALATLPLLTTRARPSRVAWASAAAALCFFPPLHAAWVAGLDGLAVGALPLMLGAMALVGGVTLSRRYRVATDDPTLAVFVAVASLGAVAAVPLELQDQWLTVAWAGEAAALAAISRRLSHGVLRWGSVALVLAVTVRLVLNPWALEYVGGGWPILNWTLYTWGLPWLAVVAATRWLSGRVPGIVSAGLTGCAIAIGFALVEVEVAHFFHTAGPLDLEESGLLHGMVRSLSWAVYGVGVLVVGLNRRRRGLRLIGLAIVLLAAGKVFGVDLWSLSGLARVGSVLGLGVSLLVVALLFERLVLRAPSPKEGA